jgi:hypothetical protein
VTGHQDRRYLYGNLDRSRRGLRNLVRKELRSFSLKSFSRIVAKQIQLPGLGVAADAEEPYWKRTEKSKKFAAPFPRCCSACCNLP